MVIRNKEYYAQFDEEIQKDIRKLNYHIHMAESYKRVYELTKGRSGVYALMNKWAKRMNQVHYDTGIKMAKSNMAWLLYEMTWLRNYIQNKSEES